jgi:fructosamine-3-kinase
MIPLVLVAAIERWFENVKRMSGRVEATRSVGGGSINDASAFVYGGKEYFIKWNSAGRYPGMFAAEARGLGLLAESACIRLPEVLHTAEAGPYAFLLLEWVPTGRPGTEFWERFGQQLAALHRNSAASFGLDHDNYIGSLTQSNDMRNNWPDFFVQMRLEPQLKLARDAGLADSGLAGRFDRLFHRMHRLFPAEPPALLHGDLWSGNYLCAADGAPVLIDPAVYYGFREVDLAMSRLFGGFDRQFYQSYNQVFPLETGWEERVGLCNLYPLMVHVNLFGSSYLVQVQHELKRFTG